MTKILQKYSKFKKKVDFLWFILYNINILKYINRGDTHERNNKMGNDKGKQNTNF